MFTIIFRYAFRNIIRTPLRSFFTLFSITLIIMLYTVLTTIGNSFNQQISKMFDANSIDIVVQAAYASTPVSSKIPLKFSKDIMLLEGVHSVESVIMARKRIAGKKSIFVMGVSHFEVFTQQLGFNLLKGRMMHAGKAEVVVGERMALLYKLKSGSLLELAKEKEYKVVGVYASWLNFLNTGVLMNLNMAQELLSQREKVNMFFIALDDTTDTSKILKTINSLYPELRAIESAQMPDTLGTIKNMFYFSKIVSALTLLIAIVVLLNTFIMAVSERTKEIGILSAIGWSRIMIVTLFFVEAMLLSCFGGLLGYALTFPVMILLQDIFPSIYMYLPSSPTLFTFIEVMIVCIAIAFLSILFPSFYGTKMQIAKAIHHE